ncbi:MAG: alpha/beta fold hydrolase [Solirubrobacterales bacterium]
MDELIPVGDDGHRLAIRCYGDGSPAVILETGFPGAGTEDFPETALSSLAEETMVCAYDRGGEGLSDALPERRRSVDDLSDDLHELTEKAEIDKPYVVAGASFGGLVAVHHAGRHPEDVAGIVMLDVPSPNPAFAAKFAISSEWDHPKNLTRVAAVDVEERLSDPLPLERIPLTVVTAESGDSDERDQRYWLDLTPLATQRTAAEGHDIFAENPRTAVKAIRETVQQASGPAP